MAHASCLKTFKSKLSFSVLKYRSNRCNWSKLAIRDDVCTNYNYLLPIYCPCPAPVKIDGSPLNASNKNICAEGITLLRALGLSIYRTTRNEATDTRFYTPCEVLKKFSVEIRNLSALKPEMCLLRRPIMQSIRVSLQYFLVQITLIPSQAIKVLTSTTASLFSVAIYTLKPSCKKSRYCKLNRRAWKTMCLILPYL